MREWIRQTTWDRVVPTQPQLGSIRSRLLGSAARFCFYEFYDDTKKTQEDSPAATTPCAESLELSKLALYLTMHVPSSCVIQGGKGAARRDSVGLENDSRYVHRVVPWRVDNGAALRLLQPKQPVSTQIQQGPLIELHAFLVSHLASRLSELGLTKQKQAQALSSQ